MGRLGPYLPIGARAFVQVLLVALNVAQIAQQRYAGAFVVGALISFVWFANARTAGRSDLPGAALVYALGAGLGTVAGMLLSSVMTG